MKRLARLPILAFLLAVPLACADSVTDPPLAPDTPETTALMDRVGGPWTEAITGSGHFVTGPLAYTPDVWRTFTINAKKSSDGSVDGSFQIILHLRDGVEVVRGDVVCFTIKGNTAWVGAHKDGNDPPDIAFQVVDNGEGSDDTADEVGLYAEATYWGFPAGFADTFCDDAPDYMDLPGFGVVPISMFRSPIAAGNIQIKVR